MLEKDKFPNLGKGVSNKKDIEEAQANTSHISNLLPPDGNVMGMPIDDYIESFRLLSSGEFARKEAPEMQVRDTQIAEFYNYFKLNHGAKTVGEALGVLRDKGVDIETVRLWVDDGLAINPKEYDAVSEGYPELANLLIEKRRSFVKAHR